MFRNVRDPLGADRKGLVSSMFDSSLRVTTLPRRSLGAGALFSAATHAAVIVAMLYAARHSPERKPDEAPEVTFRLAAAPPPPPPPPLGGAVEARTEPRKKPVRVNPDSYVPVDPAKHVKEPEPAPDAPGPGEPGGQPGGEPGGQIGGTIGGQVGGQVGGTGTVLPPTPPAPSTPPPSNQVLPFGEGMNRPQLVGGPEPVFPREAREAKVEGTLLAKCVITTEGALTGCRIIKSLPFLDQPVLEALAQRRYTPVSFQGRPVSVEYVIPFKFRIQ
jgi:periplasmic protein TonB